MSIDHQAESLIKRGLQSLVNVEPPAKKPKIMGVKTLWSVIGGAGEPTDLRTMQGKRVAIDLAGWAVQGGQCAGMQRSGVTKVGCF